MLLLSAALLLTSCDKTPPSPGPDDDTTPPAQEDVQTTPFESDESSVFVDDGTQLMIVAGGKTDFKVIRPDKSSAELKDAVGAFKTQIAEYYGIRMTYETDWTKSATPVSNDELEILVGNTNRTESQGVTDGLKDGAFIIKVVNNKVIICGTNDQSTIRAMDFFYSAYVGGNTLSLPRDTNVINLDPPKFITSSPSDYYCYTPSEVPTISVSYSANSALDLEKCTLIINGTDVTGKANWTQSKMTLNALSFPQGEYRAVITLVTKNGDANVLLKPFSVSDGSVLNVYRGEMHAHTTVSDGKGGDTTAAYTYAKNAGVDFFAVTDHSYTSSKTAYLNEQIAIADSFNKSGKFVAIYGYELTYFANSGYYGHMNIINNTSFVGANNGSGPKLTSIYGQMAALPNVIGQFNHPGYQWGTFNDFSHYSEQADKFVDIIECWSAEDEIYYSQALAKGWHVSPVFNEDTHDGTWTTKYSSVTCVLSPALTRENIIQSIKSNRTYMTDDPDMDIYYKVNDQWLGSTLKNPDKLNVSVSVSTSHVKGITRIDLVGEDMVVVASYTGNGDKKVDWNIEIDPQYDYYYVTVRAGSYYAVTAPVWVEYEDSVDITDVSQSLITGAPDNKEHGVTVSFKNNASADMSDVTVSFYQSADSGFSLVNQKPLYEVKIGKLAKGQSASASAAFAYSGTATRRITAIVSGKIGDKTFTDTANTLLNPLYMTEVLPDSGTVNRIASAYCYIELYNNTNQPIDLSKYTLRYWSSASADSNGTMYANRLSGTIAPRSSAIIWFKNKANDLSVANFSAYLGKILKEGENLIIIKDTTTATHSLAAAQGMQLDLVDSADALVITRIQYNWGDDMGEIKTGKAVTFEYQDLTTATSKKITAAATPSALTVDASQVPTVISYAEWQNLVK